MLLQSSWATDTPENTKITITLKRHPMGMTMQHPRPWLLPLPQRIIYALLSRLPREREQDQVDHDGQGDAQENAHQEPEKAPSSHIL
jgi:hypothetical protein